MIKSCMFQVARGVMSTVGIGTASLPILMTTESPTTVDLMLKIFVFLCGLITLLLSIFIGGFVNHIVNHGKEINLLSEKLVFKDVCFVKHTAMEEKLDVIIKLMRKEEKRNENSDTN